MSVPVSPIGVPRTGRDAQDVVVSLAPYSGPGDTTTGPAGPCDNERFMTKGNANDHA